MIKDPLPNQGEKQGREKEIKNSALVKRENSG
jgi:hypothetical protein